MNVLRPRFFAALLASLLFLAFGASTDTVADTKLRVIFPAPATTFALPYYVALKKGWLDGISVEERYVSGDANATRALLSGEADAAIVGTLNVLSAISGGAQLKAINSWQPKLDFHLVAAVDKVKTIGDLHGKTFAAVGPGGLVDQLARLLLRKHGVKPEDVSFIAVSGGHAPLLQVVLGERADATLINTITALRGEATGKVRIVMSAANEFPGLGYIYTIVRKADIENVERAKAFSALTEGVMKGARFIMENPSEAAAILRERIPDFDTGFVEAIVKQLNKDGVWGVNGGIELADIRETVKLFTESGGLTAKISAEEISDPRFVDRAVEKLGKFSTK